MTENHIWSHFSPFQINTQLWFPFTKWLPAAILVDRKSLSITFLAISDKYATLIFFLTKWLPIWAILDDRKSLSISFLAISDQYTTFFFKMAASGPIYAQKTIVFFHYVLSMAMPNMKMIGEFVTQFWAFFDDKNHCVVIWDLNGYGEYEFNRCICDKVMACRNVGVRQRRRNQKYNITETFKFRGDNDVART